MDQQLIVLAVREVMWAGYDSCRISKGAWHVLYACYIQTSDDRQVMMHSVQCTWSTFPVCMP